jgi:hypothetical protein
MNNETGMGDVNRTTSQEEKRAGFHPDDYYAVPDTDMCP